MKRFLAFLLALLLPCCALADDLTLQWSLEVPENGPETVYQAIGPLLPDEVQTALADWVTPARLRAIARLLNGWNLRMVLSSDGARADTILSRDGEDLLTMRAMELQGHEYLASSLFPGYALDILLDEEAERIADELLSAIVAADWDDVALLNCIVNWIDTLDMEFEFGPLVGDAYADGAYSYTYRFNDRDVAVLSESILRCDWPEELGVINEYVCTLLEIDPSAPVDAMRDAIYEAAYENRYNYVLRLVSDANDIPVGISLTTYEGDTQVMTMSLGVLWGGLDLVVGYGLRGENVYLTLSLDGLDDIDQDWSIRLWRDPTRSGYPAASANENNLLLSVDLSIRFDVDPTALRDTMNLTADATGPMLNNLHLGYLLSMVETSEQLTADETYIINGTTVFVVHGSLGLGDDIPAFDPTQMELLDLMNDPIDRQMLDFLRLFEQSLTELEDRLLEMVPEELLAQ